MDDQESYDDFIIECDGYSCKLRDLCRRYTTITNDTTLYGDHLYDVHNDHCELFWRKD